MKRNNDGNGSGGGRDGIPPGLALVCVLLCYVLLWPAAELTMSVLTRELPPGSLDMYLIGLAIIFGYGGLPFLLLHVPAVLVCWALLPPAAWLRRHLAVTSGVLAAVAGVCLRHRFLPWPLGSYVPFWCGFFASIAAGLAVGLLLARCRPPAGRSVYVAMAAASLSAAVFLAYYLVVPGRYMEHGNGGYRKDWLTGAVEACEDDHNGGGCRWEVMDEAQRAVDGV
jgi:hypothetical protein